MDRVGFIGLGRMGEPMCRHILKAGYALTVLDADPEAALPLVEAGAAAAVSPADLGAQADVILVMVPTDEDVMKVVAGEGGVLESASQGCVIAICSSTMPETALHLAELAAPAGVDIIDAPVARGVRGAHAGDLTVFAGGETAPVEKCRPVFAAFAGNVFHMGPLGKGQVTKTVNNLIHWVEVVGIYEALRLGAAHGVHPNLLRPALLAGSVESRTLRELHLVGLAWPHKDMENAIRMADETRTLIPLLRYVGELVVGMNKEQLRALFEENGTG